MVDDSSRLASKGRVLVICPDSRVRREATSLFNSCGINAHSASTMAEAAKQLKARYEFNIVVVAGESHSNAEKLVERIRELNSDVPIVSLSYRVEGTTYVEMNGSAVQEALHDVVQRLLIEHTNPPES